MSDNKSKWVHQAMSRFEMRLVRYTSRFVPEPNAREIVQEAFLRLWKEDAEQLQGRLAEWLFCVCRNQAVDWSRREGHRARAVGEMTAPAVETPEELLAKDQQQNSVLKMVGELPLEQQEVIRLKFQEDLSYKEISAITGHSVTYVGVLIHTGMATMRERVEAKK